MNMDLMVVWLLGCVLGPVFSGIFNSPVFLWPLSNRTYLSEVIQGVPQNNTQCGLAFDSVVHDYLNYFPLKFDGVRRQDLDIWVERSDKVNLLSGDVVCFIFSYLADIDISGCLIHYRHTGDGSGNYVTDLQICIVTKAICVNIVKEGIPLSATCYGNLVDIGTWRTLLVILDFDSKSVKINQGGPMMSHYVGAFDESTKLKLPGVLRIGSDLEATSNLRFKGKLTCISIYDITVSSSKAVQSIDRCFWGKPVWNHFPSGLPTATSANGCMEHQSSNYFTKQHVDAIPKSPVDRTLATRSAFLCAMQCSVKDSCQSFAFSPPTLCYLYNFQYSMMDLKEEGNFKYYYRD